MEHSRFRDLEHRYLGAVLAGDWQEALRLPPREPEHARLASAIEQARAAGPAEAAA